MTRLLAIGLIALTVVASPFAQSRRHTFALGTDDFLYDNKPTQLISCELHPARIPVEYWGHRIQMAKAMGCNTIAAYVFWNYHETTEGRFDFESDNRGIDNFFKLVQQAGMHGIVRPGPYVCAEWDFGGLPPYLLKDPDLRVRTMYPRYMQAAERYMAAFAKVIKPALVTNGGPVLMLQVENEYGSYGNDRNYMTRLRDVWKANGIDVPFFTGDGPTPYMLEAGSLPGAAVGLDSGSDEKHWELARKMNPGVPIFSSETYPGWLTHWGEKWQRPAVAGLLEEVEFLLSGKKSFNFYVAHGGTNFGFTAGANSGGKGYEPDVTSYDYDAPIDEQGNATPKYMALRAALGATIQIPAPIASMAIPDVEMQPMTSIWRNLPAPIRSVTPRTFESLGQNQGLAVYRTTLIGRKSGKLTITDLHDFATVFVDGKFIGTLDRRLGEKSIDLPISQSPIPQLSIPHLSIPQSHTPVLEILVEAMGHINFAQEIIDRKGITDRVTLNGMTLMNWETYLLPLEDEWVGGLKPGPAVPRPGTFFRGTFSLNSTADTFIDMAAYKKGVVWVNGHNLGRFWDIGPQTKLYCPASWLKKGENTIIVLDLLKSSPEAAPVRGAQK